MWGMESHANLLNSLVSAIFFDLSARTSYALSDFRQTLLYTDARTMSNYHQRVLWFRQRLLSWKRDIMLPGLLSEWCVWHDTVSPKRQPRSVLSILLSFVHPCWVRYLIVTVAYHSYLICRIIRLLITCVLQLTIMRRFEIMIGCVRLSLIYFVSGIGGYLASASFVPYMVSSFCHKDLTSPWLARGRTCRIPRWNSWCSYHQCNLQLEILEEPDTRITSSPGSRTWFVYHRTSSLYRQLGSIIWILVWNFNGHGWASSFIEQFSNSDSLALIPYIEFGKGTRLIIVTFSLLITCVLFSFLLVLFYGLPVIDIPLLTLFNCPFVDSKVCHQQGLILKSWLPI